MFSKGRRRRVKVSSSPLSHLNTRLVEIMKFLISSTTKAPLLKIDNERIINLNTLEECNTNICSTCVRAGKNIKISQHKNQKFLEKAAKFFSISKISKAYGTSWYKLESNMVLFCIVQGDQLQLIGNYPTYYLKLLYRYINSL